MITKPLIGFIMVIVMNSCEEKIANPPLAPSFPVTDQYHGQKVEDPYRNLENLKDSVVLKWLKMQGDHAFSILEEIPGREELVEKQESYDDRQGGEFRLFKRSKKGNHFYTRMEKIGEKSKLYFKESFESDEVLLFDSSNYSHQEEFQISYIKPNRNGDKIAICLSKKGEEISEGIILDVRSKQILPGKFTNVLHSIGGVEWLSDDTSIFYLYCPNVDPTNEDYWTNTKTVIYNSDQGSEEYREIFSSKSKTATKIKPEDFPLVYNFDSSDGYLFGVVGGADSFYDIYYAKESELLKGKASWQMLFRKSAKIKRLRMDNQGNLFYLSADNAPNHKINKIPISKIGLEDPEILVSQKEDATIDKFELTKEGLFYTTLKNGVEAKLFFLDNKKNENEIELPKVSGNINISSYGSESSFLRVVTTGSLEPYTNYFYNIRNNKFEKDPFFPTKEYSEFDDLVVEQVEIPSHDDVLVPISIVRNKNIRKDGSNPTMFFGYGSYGSVRKPSFNPNFLLWVAEGGILVFPDVRGSGQKGESWHKAGFKTTKPNTWKDMIAATEYMIKEGYTNPEKTALWGSSAGGILAGRAMTDRPDLYRAVIMTSPALNMLRSEIQPNGKNSIKEFGTVEIKEEFEALLEMDSYHHIKKGVKYPATLVTGGMKDGRVVIWDPAKFVAKLQAYNSSNNPVLFAVKIDQGHSASNSGKMDRYELYANAFSFALWQMGYEEYQPKL